MANIYKTSAATDSGSINYHINEYSLAQGLGRLNNDLIVTRLITNYSDQAKAQGSRYGQSVRIPKTGSVSVATKTPGTAATPSASTSTKADIAINTHKTWDALFEDYGALMAQNGVLVQYVQDASHAMAEAIENSVIALYASASAQVGTQGSGLAVADLTALRMTSRTSSHLFSQANPSYLVYGVYGEEDLNNLSQLTDFDRVGNVDALERSYHGRRFNFDLYTSNLMPTISGTPGAEHAMAFQSDAMGIAFVDMATAAVDGASTAGVEMATMMMPDDMGRPAYSMRMIKGYSQLDRGTILTVDTIYGVGVVRSEHLIDVLV